MSPSMSYENNSNIQTAERIEEADKFQVLNDGLNVCVCVSK